MEHIAALLLIIGCSDELAQCQELPAPVAIYETAEECDNALPLSSAEFKGQHPRIFVQCVPVDPALEEEDAELTWDVTPAGVLVAAIGAPDVLVASNSQQLAQGSLK